LDLSNQNLNSLHDFPFQDLEMLESFDASHNKLQRTFLSLLCKCERLKKVRLHHNDIQTLTAKDLLRLPQGFLLDVSYNKIKDFPDVKLQWKENCFIDLRENPLTETATNKIILATRYNFFYRAAGVGRAILEGAVMPIFMASALTGVVFIPLDYRFYFNFYDLFLNRFMAAHLSRSACKVPIHWLQIRNILQHHIMKFVGQRWNNQFVATFLDGADSYAYNLIEKGVNIDLVSQNDTPCEALNLDLRNRFTLFFDSFFDAEKLGFCTGTYKNKFNTYSDSFIDAPSLRPTLDVFKDFGPYTLKAPLNISTLNLSINATCKSVEWLPSYVLALIGTGYCIFSIFFILCTLPHLKNDCLYHSCVIRHSPKEDIES
jgi:Leucine-rich repeat (LRR) protein